jgi:hypothetical protein
MPAIETNVADRMPAIGGDEIPVMSDDECIARLAEAIEKDHDSEHLEEVARLIGRLAVTVE